MISRCYEPIERNCHRKVCQSANSSVHCAYKETQSIDIFATDCFQLVSLNLEASFLFVSCCHVCANDFKYYTVMEEKQTGLHIYTDKVYSPALPYMR